MNELEYTGIVNRIEQLDSLFKLREVGQGAEKAA